MPTCAERNAQRAGVDLATVCVHADDVIRPSRPGWIVTNPPYGTRLGTDPRRVYESVGRLAAPPWHLAVVAAVGTPTSAFGRDWTDSLSTRNGGIPVRFLKA